VNTDVSVEHVACVLSHSARTSAGKAVSTLVWPSYLLAKFLNRQTLEDETLWSVASCPRPEYSCVLLVGRGWTGKVVGRKPPPNIFHPFQKLPQRPKLWMHSEHSKCFWSGVTLSGRSELSLAATTPCRLQLCAVLGAEIKLSGHSCIRSHKKSEVCRWQSWPAQCNAVPHPGWIM
jgi:hypothetical protein